MQVDWSELFRSSYEDLVRYVHARIWDPDRAQDIAQEAFVRALRQRPPPTNPLAWLFTVATNMIRDDARTAVRRRRHLELLKAESAPDPEPTVDERSDRIERLRVALDSLNVTERDALLLWDAGLNYADIADSTGLSVRSVGTTLSRARKKLASLVSEQEGTDVAHR